MRYFIPYRLNNIQVNFKLKKIITYLVRAEHMLRPRPDSQLIQSRIYLQVSIKVPANSCGYVSLSVGSNSYSTQSDPVISLILKWSAYIDILPPSSVVRTPTPASSNEMSEKSETASIYSFSFRIKQYPPSCIYQ